MLKELMEESNEFSQMDCEIVGAVIEGLAVGLNELVRHGIIAFPGGYRRVLEIELALDAAAYMGLEKILSLAPGKN